MDASENQRPSKKRRMMHAHTHAGRSQKQAGKWQTQKARSNSEIIISASGIHNDDRGIFVTCDKGQEHKCLREMSDLLSQYVEGTEDNQAKESAPEGDTMAAPDSEDVEYSIQKELESMRPSASSSLFTFVKLDIPCVSFVKTGDGVDPVSLVHRICKDAHSEPDRRRSRFIKRMTPMTLIRKTLGSGLEYVCDSVLRPHFRAGGPSQKYAIRPTIRNNTISRDEVIKTVANAVGPGHSVDLKNYDLLILVDVYRNVCGMSVVGNDFEQLKKFNLAEIYQPTPKPINTAQATPQKLLGHDVAVPPNQLHQTHSQAPGEYMQPLPEDVTM